jgi:hypothetical protein
MGKRLHVEDPRRDVLATIGQRLNELGFVGGVGAGAKFGQYGREAFTENDVDELCACFEAAARALRRDVEATACTHSTPR